MKMTKKVLSILLSLMLVLGTAAAGGVSVSALSGSGTATDPYQIESYAELKEFAVIVNGTDEVAPNPSVCAVLTADITANDKNWVPIAKSGCTFTGTFDGDGHKITGLDNSESGSRWEVGLFGFIGEGGSVKDVRLESANFGGNNIGGIAHENRGTISGCYFGGTIACGGHAGGIAKRNHGTISNCYNTGTVSCDYNAGGLAGDNYGTISNCYNTGDVTGIDCIGGIVGMNSGEGKTVNCYNTGNVTATGDGARAGGVVGLIQKGNSAWTCSVTNCYSTGAVTVQGENADAGGVVGYNDNCTVENCYYDNEKCDCEKAVGNSDDTGTVKGLATAQMTGESALESMTFSYEEGATSPWLTKENADGWAYYPHLSGFAYDSVSTDANWPAKTEYTAPVPPTGDERYSVTLRAGSAEFEYDGTEKVVDCFAEGINTNDNGDVLITIGEHNYRITGYSVYTSLTNAGDVATNVVTSAKPVVYDEDNNDVTDKFAINTAPGRLEVSKRQVTLTSEGGVKEYDGTPLINANVTATNLIPNNYDITGIQAVGRQVYVGSSPNTILYTVRTDVAENYDIHLIEGTLTVNSRSAKYEITVTAGSVEKTYDGEAAVVNDYTADTLTFDGKKYTLSGLSVEASRTDAGTTVTQVVGNPVITDRANKVVTDQFTVTRIPGAITINPRPITITGNDIEKKYTGMAVVPTMDDVTIGSGFVGEDGIESIAFSGSRTLIGTSPYEITGWTFKEGTNPANYDVTATGANITVIDNDEIQYEITIGGVAAGNGSIREKVYDGNELVVTGYTVNAEATNVTFGNWIANHLTDTQNVESSFTLTTPDGNAETFVVSIPEKKVTARQTDVGSDYYKWQKSDVTITNNGVDVTNEFMIQLEPVNATVTKKQITLTSGTTLDFIYNGDPHRNTEVEISGRLEKDRDLAVFEFSGFPSVTNVGEIKSNEFEVVSLTGDKAGNYSYKTVFGQIGVVAGPDDLLDSTTIFAKSGGGTYNGQQQSVSGWNGEISGNIEFSNNGNTYYVDVTNLPVGATGTNVSDSKKTSYSGTYRILDSNKEDVTNNFKPVTMKMGTLTIEPVALTITSASGERGYNGDVYRLDEASVTDGEFVGEEGATYNFTGGRVKLGSVENTFTYTLKPNTLAENYDITTAFGTLNVINEAGTFDVTVTAASDSILYDGTTHTINSFAAGVDEDATADGIQTTIDGNTYTITGLSVYQSAKDATEGRTVNITGTPVVTDDAGNNVTDSFIVHVASGELVINKRNVTLTSPDITYTYDGNVHTISDDEIIVGGDGWAAGEGVTYTKTPIRNVGIKTNAFTYTMEGATKEGNYNITKNEGTLEVVDTGIDPELVVQNVLNDSSDVYDIGDEITYTVSVTNIYDEAKTITLSVPEGVILEQSVFENVEPGAQTETLARYTVTSSDIVAGKFENTVTAALADKRFAVTEGSAKIAAENADITVTKTLSAINGVAVTPGESVTVKIGDELTYIINATNNGNVDLNNVIVTDELTGNSWTVGILQAGSASTDFNAVYTVTAADVAAGAVRNTAKVTTTGDDDSADQSDPCDEKVVAVNVDRNFKVTYIVDGEELTTMDAICGEPVPQPRTPQKEGYTFAWVDEIPETMPAEDVTINGTFTIIEYTATFVDKDGNTVKEVKFTVEDESITEPAVPEKTNYTGEWEEYTLGANDITIKPVYTLAGETKVTADCESEITLGYKESKRFAFEPEFIPDGATAHVFYNGEDRGEGTSIEVKEPTDDYTVECKVLDKDGNEIASSGEIKVKVKNSFFDRLKWFFNNLLRMVIEALIEGFGSVC